MESKVTPKKRTKSPEQALSALMRLCARAERSSGDARRLMRGWGVAPDEVEKVLARLLEERFIDDSRYAEAYVREKSRLAGWGAYKIRAALQRKAIAREVIDQALAQVDNSLAVTRLQERLQRKMRSTKADTPYALRTKLLRYGLSLGFSYEEVQREVEQLIQIQDDTLCNSIPD